MTCAPPVLLLSVSVNLDINFPTIQLFWVCVNPGRFEGFINPQVIQQEGEGNNAQGDNGTDAAAVPLPPEGMDDI